MNPSLRNRVRLASLALLLVGLWLLAACSPAPQTGGEAAPASSPVSASVDEPASLPTGVPVVAGGEVVGPSGAELTSQDGGFSLSIPAGALASEVPIRIAALPADRWTGALADLDPASVVYALEPSGLTFEQPVVFHLTMPTGMGADGSLVPPVAFVVNDAGAGELVDLDVRLDGETGRAVMTGSLQHFSWVVGHDGGLAVGLEHISPRERRVGAPWEAGVLVRNVTHNRAGIELSVAVNRIRFESLGEVEVVGSDSHPGFNLKSGEERQLDLPVPRWQCGDEGEGHYRVVVMGNLGGDLFSNLVQWRSEHPNLWESLVGNQQPIQYVVLAEAPVVCVYPAYQASTQSGNISITGRVSDVNEPFALSGTFEGGSAELTFTPDLVPLESNLSPGGIFAYTGGGSGATVSGDGSYTLSGTLGQPLTLSFTGQGCANPGRCADTNGVILLTPIDP